MAGLRAVASRGVGAMAERVLVDLEALVARMGRAYQEEIPEYAAMSDATMLKNFVDRS